MFSSGSPSNSAFAGDVPDELIEEFSSLIARAHEVGKRINALAIAPLIAEGKRRKALTPKQRRDEDYQKALAKFQERTSA